MKLLGPGDQWGGAENLENQFVLIFPHPVLILGPNFKRGTLVLGVFPQISGVFMCSFRGETSVGANLNPFCTSGVWHSVAGAVSTHHHLYPGFFFMNLRQSALYAGG